MSYDIPDKIQYKEKIVFGLDLKQLGYFCLFGLLAFFSLNLPLEGQVKFILPAIFSIVGVGFIFLNIEEKLLDAYHYYSGVRKAGSFDSKAQRLMGIKAIENDAITLMDGGLRAILQVEPINFGLLDESQKKALISNYREFLNHLTSPIQILVRTEKSNSEDVFKSAQERLKGSPESIVSIFSDFFLFEQNYAQANNVRERKCYLIVSHQPQAALLGKGAANLEDAKQLDQKAKIIREKLIACGLASERLDTSRLLNFFATYSMKEGDENGEPEAESPINTDKAKPDFFLGAITPDFDIMPHHAKVNGVYHRIVRAIGYPRNVDDAWLESFLATSEPYDISLHINPATISSTLVNIHNQLIKQSSDLLSSKGEGTPNPSLEIKCKDTMKVYGLLYKGKEKMFQVSLYVDCQAKDLKELDLLTEKCKANMNALLIVPKTTDFRMAEGIKSMLPLVVDALGSRRDFLTSSLSATFPFLYPVDSKKNGLFFAHERKTLNPLFIDFDSMSNKHFFVLGISGAGKSYAAKFLLMQHLLAQNAKIYILDPNSEYSDIVARLGGGNIVLSKDSDSIINLFDLAGEDFGGKMLTLISVFDIITGGLTESQKGVLNEALVRVYREKGIEATDPRSWTRKPPKFSDLQRVLESMARKIRRRVFSHEERSVEVLLNRVKMYSKNGFFGFLDKETKVDMTKRLMDFDLSELAPQVKQLVMFSVLELISREIKRDKSPKVVLIDEGWSLLRSKEAESYILEFVKTSRKFNASIGFITQEIEDLLRSEGGKSILNTTSTKILLRQNSSNLDLISKTLALNDRERDFLLRAEKGHGLLITEHGRYEFMVKAPPLIHSLITTDPNDEKKIAPFEAKPKARKKKSKIDEERGFYNVKEISEDEKDFLLSKGYVFHNSLCLNASGGGQYVVKRRSNESSEHALLCWAVADEIRERGGDVEVKATVEADVIARINGKTVCFEIETGENLEWHGPEYVKIKMAERKRECDRLIIVVAKRLLKSKYAMLTNTKTITRTEVKGAIARLFK